MCETLIISPVHFEVCYSIFLGGEGIYFYEVVHHSTTERLLYSAL